MTRISSSSMIPSAAIDPCARTAWTSLRRPLLPPRTPFVSVRLFSNFLPLPPVHPTFPAPYLGQFRFTEHQPLAAFPSLTSSPLLFSTLSGHLIKSSFSLISCDPWQRGTSPPAGPRPGLLPPLRAPCSSPWSGHLSFPRCALRTTPPYWQKSSTSRPDPPTIRVPVTGFSASPCSRSPVFNASNVLFWRVVVVLYLPKFRWIVTVRAAERGNRMNSGLVYL